MFASESVYKNFSANSRKNVYSFFKLYYKSFIKSEKPSAKIHDEFKFIQKIQICLQNFKEAVTYRSQIMKFSDKQKKECKVSALFRMWVKNQLLPKIIVCNIFCVAIEND